MLCCDSCGSWLHALCQGISSSEATQLSDFVCNACEQEEAHRKKRKLHATQRKKKKEQEERKRKREINKKEGKKKTQQKKHKGKGKKEGKKKEHNAEERASEESEEEEVSGDARAQGTPNVKPNVPLEKICFPCRSQGFPPELYLHAKFARKCRACGSILPSKEKQRELLRIEYEQQEQRYSFLLPPQPPPQPETPTPPHQPFPSSSLEQPHSQPQRTQPHPRGSQLCTRCIWCEKAHQACSGGRPCERCIASGCPERCEDVQPKKRKTPELRMSNGPDPSMPSHQSATSSMVLPSVGSSSSSLVDIQPLTSTDIQPLS